MEIFLNGGEYRISTQDRQLVLSELRTRTNREDKQAYEVYTNSKFFNRPDWLFKYMLRKEICCADASSLQDILTAIQEVERNVEKMASDLNQAWKEMKNSA